MEYEGLCLHPPTPGNHVLGCGRIRDPGCLHSRDTFSLVWWVSLPGGVTPWGLVSRIPNHFGAQGDLVSVVKGAVDLPEGKQAYIALKNKFGLGTYPESVGADVG